VSYALALEGPSLVVDTACSSSLVAVHLACQSLRSGECALALAGGVNLILKPHISIGFSQANMLAPDGRCKFCDARGNGFVRSEGVGVVVLKPLSLALAERDQVYAVILGSAVNNDGYSNGLLMTPGRGGQEAVLRTALRNARVSADQVHYVEAHGTGTSVGDPIEVKALGSVLAESHSKEHPCVIGSVKTNIGHTEAAAGIAGLIKVALCLIVPNAVIGHSMGEVAAAHVVGALDLEDAVRIICLRSRLLKQLSGQGTMAVVELSLEQAQHSLVGYDECVSIAASNSPISTVLSGDPAALEEILNRLRSQDVFCHLVKVDVASHSPQMDLLRDDLLLALGGLQPRPASIPIYSTVMNKSCTGLEFDATYWMRNLRERVNFSTAVYQLLDVGYDTFLEVSPHPILLSPIQQVLRHFGRTATVLPSLRREGEDRTTMLASLGNLYTLGQPVDWNRLYPSEGQCVRLPSYPWQRERFWFEDQETKGRRNPKPSLLKFGRVGISGHPLLGQYLKSAIHPETHFWEMDLDTALLPYLRDHRVQGMIVLPAAAYIEIALAAASKVFGSGFHILEQLNFQRMLFLPTEGSQTIQLVIYPKMTGKVIFQFFSLQQGDAQRQASWTQHATGVIHLNQGDVQAPLLEQFIPEKIQDRCRETISRTEHYQALLERGLHYGPSFQGIEQLWRRDGEAIAQLRLPETTVSEAGAYQVHPAILDACFQVLEAALPREDPRIVAKATYLPVGMESLRVYDRPRNGIWCRALVQPVAKTELDRLAGDVFLFDESGQIMLEARGLRVQQVDRDVRRHAAQNIKDWLYITRWELIADQQQAYTMDPLPVTQQGSWIIFTDSQGAGQRLKSLLQARGENCVMVSPGETYDTSGPNQYRLNPARPEDFRRLVESVYGGEQRPCSGIVHLWSLEATPPEEVTLAALMSAQVLGCGSVLHLIQALAKDSSTKEPPHLWLVTSGAQAVGPEGESTSIAQSPLWGLGRVIFSEHPELCCTRVDLGSPVSLEEIESLFQEFWSSDHEDQIALRGSSRYVPRLVRYAPVAREAISQGPSVDGKISVIPRNPRRPFLLEISPPGILDNLTLRAATRSRPAPGEIEIQVYAAGLNFMDVMRALGTYPGQLGDSIPLGVECAGRISALGEGADGFQLGDEVLAITPSSRHCMSTFATTSAHLVVHKPAHLSFEEAAALPIAFLTVFYALHHLGKLFKGERILIHSATGGIGLAAVQLANYIGAEVFATAGSPEKREFLKSLGVQNVLDSRSLNFADEILELTNAEGVDVVLNSLAGEAIPKGLSILRDFGRFFELGKRDIEQNSQLGLHLLRKNVSFFAVDVDGLVRERPAFAGSLLLEVVRHVKEGTLSPPPVRVFPISEAASAFRHMAQAKHIGKIALSMDDREVWITPPSKGSVTFRSDATYLITGGLGGLGLSVAQWMIGQGAQHLVLMGRNGATAAVKEVLDALKEGASEIVVAQADVSQREQVAHILSSIRRSMPPLRGIIHAAGILDDDILLQLDQERLLSVMAPKISGAWNLHSLTLDTSLDFFVLFSSAASLLGSPGQGNYAAANEFLNALAHHRRARGLPALSINWGPWGEVGLAARTDRKGRLAFRGFASMSPKQGVETLGQLLGQDISEIAVIPANWQHWDQFYPAASRSRMVAHLSREESGVPPKADDQPGKVELTRRELLATGPGERQELLETYLGMQIARVMGLSAPKLDVHQALNNLGLDSLMAVELKNLVEARFKVRVPVVTFLEGISLNRLVKQILDELATETFTSSGLYTGPENAEQFLAKIDQLSNEEVNTLLSELLAEGGEHE
jgi:acyl transferase domain-containing protein/acyl carrier protein